MSENDNCVICNGKGKNMFNENCTYCNGTGEPNNLAEEYMRNHICQCMNLDRKFCPICGNACHHDSSQTPKQRIDPGYGGMTATISISTSDDNAATSQLEEEFLTV